MSVVGQAPRAARFAGFSTNRIVWASFLISGGLAGLAGVFEAAGPVGQLVPALPVGYGFTAIIVAFLGRLHPLGVLAAGLLLALTYIGGESAQIAMSLPASTTHVFQGLLLFFLLAADGPDQVSAAVRGHLKGQQRLDLVVNILAGMIIAATPLIFAAIGELVVEKSGRPQPWRRGHDDYWRHFRVCCDL